MQVEKPLWEPSAEAVAHSPLSKFMSWCSERCSRSFEDYDAFHTWSVEEPGDFWQSLWEYCGVLGDLDGPSLVENGKMPEARFFPEARLNFAENLLKYSGDDDALIFRGEDKVSYRWSWDTLRAKVSLLQQAMRDMGLGPGDRVAAMMPNMPETYALMLAATSLGAIWSSCSPDFGDQGVLDRFGQIEPKLFIACDAYWYNGKLQDISEKLRSIAGKIGAPVLVVHYAGDADALAASLENGQTLERLVEGYEVRPLEFVRMPFRHPLYVLFSSGTTGAPKCIVHCAGGILLQHLKEHHLHFGIEPGERLFYFTTCSWMMWNWLASGMASGATLCLFDGSPFYPDGNVLFDYAEQEKFAIFGTSAKYIDAIRKSGMVPRKSHDLSALRFLASTGSPLSPEGFDFAYEGVKPDMHMGSISGGTDIAACFVMAVPTKPVWTGEIQGAALGMATDVWSDDGKPVKGEKGELVCTRAFPSMPLKSWLEDSASNYHAAYFERFGNVWCQGDYAEWTAHGGMVIHGRSDATLNPGGVRIGTAEIYNQVEQLDEIVEAICIGQEFDDDTRVILFVRLADGVVLDDDLIRKIKTKIRVGASPRHVPAKVIAVADIPRTKSGKIVELAVREVVHGRRVKNREALANPEALELFADLEALQT